MIPQGFRPLLASDAVLENLRFPLMCSYKLDGVRACTAGGAVLSRTLKYIPNRHTQSLFKHLDGVDGELIVGPPNDPHTYNTTVSAVMSKQGTPNVKYHVFDTFHDPSVPYSQRHSKLIDLCMNERNVIIHTQYVVHGLDHLLAIEQAALNEGYEGLILRSINGKYKYGRSTEKQGILLKLKRFKDSEATVVGFQERMYNMNESLVDERGYLKKDHIKSNMVGRNDLGALIVKKDAMLFNIGTGFTDAERADIWNNRDRYIGKLVKYKYFSVGMKDAPRHPVFLGWRYPIDT